MTNWILWLIAGIVSVLGGLIALANPFAATLTATLIAGWAFIFVGILTVLSAFGDRSWSARIMALLLGVVIFLLGANLIGNPLVGALSLTWIAAAMLLAAGIFRVLVAFGTDHKQIKGIMIVSGLISIALGIMIFANFPESAVVVLGVFLAVELLSNGVSLIVLALARRSGNATDVRV